MKFEFIDSQKCNHKVILMCKVLNVSKSGFYAWKGNDVSALGIEDAKIKDIIMKIYEENRCVYGVPRIMVCLKKQNISISKRRCERLMKELGIQGVSKRKSRPKSKVLRAEKDNAIDLVCRKFFADKPNQIWFADITYVKTYEGWIYLALVFDIFSRMIVGWSMDENMTAKLVDDALRMAIGKRKPENKLIHHSDHGGQYRSLLLGKTMEKYNIVPSMGAIASPWDNAATESLMSTIKSECTDIQAYKTRKEAVLDIFDYIEVFYNSIRLHSSIDNMSPLEYEELYYRELTKVG